VLDCEANAALSIHWGGQRQRGLAGLPAGRNREPLACRAYGVSVPAPCQQHREQAHCQAGMPVLPPRPDAPRHVALHPSSFLIIHADAAQYTRFVASCKQRLSGATVPVVHREMVNHGFEYHAAGSSAP
jgi:hypothetical protein